jgi:hypothetical protein
MGLIFGPFPEISQDDLLALGVTRDEYLAIAETNYRLVWHGDVAHINPSRGLATVSQGAPIHPHKGKATHFMSVTYKALCLCAMNGQITGLFSLGKKKVFFQNREDLMMAILLGIVEP